MMSVQTEMLFQWQALYTCTMYHKLSLPTTHCVSKSITLYIFFLVFELRYWIKMLIDPYKQKQCN